MGIGRCRIEPKQGVHSPLASPSRADVFLAAPIVKRHLGQIMASPRDLFWKVVIAGFIACVGLVALLLFFSIGN